MSYVLQKLRHRLRLIGAAVRDPWSFRITYKAFRLNQTVQKPLELFWCIRWLRKQHLTNVMEIGSWQGGTLFVWSQLSVDNAHLISLDLNRVGDSSELVKRFQGFMKPGQSLVCLRQDSHLPASLEAVKTALTGRELDFLFIDGDHTFDGVKQDFEMYSRFVKPGGWIAFHDIIENPAQPDYGVPAYWRELRDKYHCVEFVDERNPLKGGAGIGILQTPLEQRPLPDGRPALAVRADA